MYNHLEIEKKWQKFWEENKLFYTDVNDFSKPKYYCLDMFPYPSGVGLHAGHPEGYTATDVISRMKRMQGYNVLHPMGFDSFGLPAEQFAITTGKHPSTFTNENIKTFREQLKMLGFSYDWSKEISTSAPNFYKWTQWIFTKLYSDGFAKYEDRLVNWCEELGTVLANDEVVDGKSERGGYPVVRKNMKQWVIDIPRYAERLLSGLDELDWPESTKEIQRNWIGKSEGAIVKFKVNESELSFNVFTTRCDTLFGATYCVLSPEHKIVDAITTENQRWVVDNYKKECSMKSDMERTELNKEKTGVFTGAYAINPVNNKLIPIWISDYVLLTYGTGAIMAVPAHDERDYEFAKKFGLEIIPVIEDTDITIKANVSDGTHINSEFLNGLDKKSAIEKMINYLEENNIGTRKVNYKIREWIFSRQRYWGEPIPIIHLEDGRDVVVSSNELPLVLPELEDYSPNRDGLSPLEKATSWTNVSINGVSGKRETSTMPGSAGSSWYFLRYIDPFNSKAIADKDLLSHWMPVDLYVGGPEHAVGHLLYSRMWNNYLYDIGISPVKEPFKKLVHQGMILGSNGIKMGKRFPEFVVNPTDVVQKYGADTLRLYEMFMGPLEADKPWNDDALLGSRKFLERVWRLYTDNNFNIVDYSHYEEIERIFNQTVKKVTEDYNSLNINTAISQMMIFINAIYKNEEHIFNRKHAEDFLKLLHPLCPHITEELWHEVLNHNESLVYESWPIYDESKIENNTFELVIQVNGKIRGKEICETNLSNEDYRKIAISNEKIMEFINGKEIKKVIVIKGKLVNIVI